MKHLATLLMICACALAGAAHAQSAALSGVLGSKALLVVNSGAPKSVGVGEIYQGVKVVSVDAGQAVVEIGGKQQTLRMGEAPVSAAGTGGGAVTKIVLYAGTNGHFRTQGQINGRTVNFMVDTGASGVGISVADAQRIGLNYQAGQRVQMNTANGSSIGWYLKLNSVRVGSVDIYNVDVGCHSRSHALRFAGQQFSYPFSDDAHQ